MQAQEHGDQVTKLQEKHMCRIELGDGWIGMKSSNKIRLLEQTRSITVQGEAKESKRKSQN